MTRRPFLLILLTAIIATGCANKPPQVVTEPAIYERSRMVLDDVDAPLEVYDPWEGFNRTMYRLNANMDTYVLLPAVSVYQRIVPGFARRGVTNFFENVSDITTLINQVAQLKVKPAAQTTGRFVTNSTIGALGLFDVATPLGIPKHEEDFGQTLGHYRIADGPYLVLPLFGPSSLRDGFGRAVDAGTLSLIDPLQLDDHTDRRYAYYPLLVLDTRATTAFEYYQTGSPFEYELVRLLYRTMRQLDVAR